MLRLMRDYATSWMIKFILGAIVLVFVFWGVGSFDSGSAGKVAVVNDRVITIEEYREAYNNLVERMRSTFGGTMDQDMIEALGIRRQALDSLINEALLVQRAEALDFRVTDEELAAAIRNIPAFQRAGVFDSRLYQNVLSRYRMTPEQFEVSQRKAMLADKVRQLVIGTVQVSDDEAMTWYTWQNARVSLDYVHFSPDAYDGVTATAEEVRSRFEENPAPYKTEEKVKVRYIRFAPDDFEDEAAVSEAQVRQYYEANREEFSSPKTVEARHILFKVPEGADQKTVEAQREKALEVLQMARDGEDFADLAREYSEGPSAEKGGFLGAFKKGDMVPPFSEKAFSMEAGELGGPVRTRFGWHLILVEKVNEPQQASFEEAKDKIREKLSRSDARTLAYDEAGEVYDVSFEGDDLVFAAEERGLPLKTTGFFTRTGPQKDIEDRVEFARAAFSLEPMEISDIVELSDGYYLIQLLEKQPSRVPDLAEVADEVREDLIAEKRDRRAKKDANAFLEAVGAGAASMEELARQQGRSVQTTGLFKRGAQIPEIGRAQEISQAAFMLTRNEPLAESALRGPEGYYVIRLNEREKPPVDGFAAQKEAIVRNLQRQKEQQAFADWLDAVKAKSEIVIEEEFAQ